MGSENPCDSLKFEVEERIECGQSSKVKYTHRAEYLLSLPVPLEAATNKGQSYKVMYVCTLYTYCAEYLLYLHVFIS